MGKSSLFNRIVRSQEALVQDEPGVTRDRLYREASWMGHSFFLVDTGGFSEGVEGAPWAPEVSGQVLQAVRESACVLFVVDGRAGTTPADEELADRLRPFRDRVLLVANKVDDVKVDTTDLYRLGFGAPWPVSAAHGKGVGDLLDEVVQRAPKISLEEDEAEDVLHLAIIGRPNAGKSTLFNRLFGSDRVVVSDRPGTTTDSVEATLSHGGRPFVLVDTAGIRRHAKVGEKLEARAANRAKRTIERCDVAVLLIDGTTGLTQQDKRVAGLAQKEGRGLVFAVNKWDAVEKDTYTAPLFEASLREQLPAFEYAPCVFISAQTGQRVDRLLDVAFAVFENASRRVPTSELNRVLRAAVARNPLPSSKGRAVRIYYATQVDRRPPHFVLFTNVPEAIHFSYERYVERQLREAFSLNMTPLRLTFRLRE